MPTKSRAASDIEGSYFQWTNDFGFPSPDEIRIPDSFRKIDLFMGKRLKKPLPMFDIVFEERHELADVIPSSQLVLLFSKRLVEFLAATYPKKLFQTVPLRLTMKGKVSTGDYFLVNLVNTRDVIDKEKSKLVMGSYANIVAIRSLALDGVPFADDDIFRLDGFVSLLLCSASFVERMKEQDFPGMKFVPLAKVRT